MLKACLFKYRQLVQQLTNAGNGERALTNGNTLLILITFLEPMIRQIVSSDFATRQTADCTSDFLTDERSSFVARVFGSLRFCRLREHGTGTANGYHVGARTGTLPTRLGLLLEVNRGKAEFGL